MALQINKIKRAVAFTGEIPFITDVLVSVFKFIVENFNQNVTLSDYLIQELPCYQIFKKVFEGKTDDDK